LTERSRRSTKYRRSTSAVLVFLTVPVLFGGSATAVAAPDPGSGNRLEIQSVSNPRPSLVSGAQVLLRVVAKGTPRVHVTANGADVTAAFRAQPDGTLLGLVSGLRDGPNDVTAEEGTGRPAHLRITNHPSTGPVFSGRQQQPFYCETTAYGLPPATPPLCTAPTQVTYQYRNTAGAFLPLADPAGRPPDLATAHVDGRAVPYIVRVERGTIDRAVYELAALADGPAPPSPLVPDTGWNGTLVYTFGGGCNAGYHQGATTGGVLNDLFLGQGYAVASSSLNVLDNNCSPIISAEAAMMVKEHFVETYGPVRHTIGWGGSGGAIQQYDIADSYPGILDGIIPGTSYPDSQSVSGPVADCVLLNRFFAGPGAAFTPAQRQAVSGFADYTTCLSWDQQFGNRFTATGSCNPAIPVSARWDPVTNPDGVKCGANEQLANQLGRDPRTGFVRNTLDNTGVQYGLSALRAGKITAAQFAGLNSAAGGLDYTGKPVAARSVADPFALFTVHAEDIVNSASQGLRSTPIIDQRTDLDFAGAGVDIHTTEWSFTMRQRLREANGTAANQVIIENQPTPDGIDAAGAYELDAMDRWLTGIDADHSGQSPQRKVLANRPPDLGDGCYLSATQRIQQPLEYPASGQCGALYPVALNTRMAAGEGLAMDVIKCRLRPLDFRDYPVSFTPADQRRLRDAFPSGVCDYGKPGEGAHQPIGPWLGYGDEHTGTTPPVPLPTER
jgi:hypothetical protein